MLQKTVHLDLGNRVFDQHRAEELCRDTVHRGTNDRVVVAIDGPCGSGKSGVSEEVRRALEGLRIPCEILSTDLDVLPWSERPEASNLMDWHGDELICEALNSPGAEIIWLGYDVVKHTRSKVARVRIPREGVLIVEGLHAIDRTLQFANDPVVAISLDTSLELSEIRRWERNVTTGRWKESQAAERTKHQRKHLVDYYKDLRRDMRFSSGIRKNPQMRWS